MVNLVFGHLTTRDVNVEAAEVGWKMQRVTALSTIDAGSHFRTMYCIPDPEPLAAFNELYNIEEAAIDQLIAMIDHAQQPDSIQDVVLNRMARYKMELPVICLLDITRARIAGGKPKDGQSGIDARKTDSKPYTAYSIADFTDGIPMAGTIPLPQGAVMYADQAPVMPANMFGQLQSIGEILLRRLNPKHRMSVSGIIDTILGKMRARLTGTDLKGRLEDPLHDMILALHLLTEAWEQVLSQNGTIQRAAPIDVFYIRNIAFQMIEQIQPILSQDITFLEDEMANMEGTNTIHAADEFRRWMLACSSYLKATSFVFKTMPVPRMVTAHSGVPGYYDLFFDIDWSRVNYMTSSGAPGAPAILDPLELNGFSSNVLLPSGISRNLESNYRTSRGHDSMGTEMMIPLCASAEDYHLLIDTILVTGNERSYPRDPIMIDMDVDSPFHTERLQLKRQVFPLRGSMLRQGMMGLNLPHGMQIQVLDDQVISSKQPAALLHQLVDVPHMVVNPPFEIYSPWGPRL